MEKDGILGKSRFFFLEFYDIIRCDFPDGSGFGNRREMGRMTIILYTIISLLLGGADLVLAMLSYRYKSRCGYYLAACCCACALVDVFYLFSVMERDYFIASCFSSAYFLGVDLLVLTFLCFIAAFTGRSIKNRPEKVVLGCLLAYFAFEVLVFCINPFFEIAVHYLPQEARVAHYVYQKLPLYYMHLIYTYGMCLLVVFLLVRKLVVTPGEYRKQYWYMLFGLLMILAVNAIFLYIPGKGILNRLDMSILGYSLVVAVSWWTCFKYTSHGMLNTLKGSVFESIGQGILLFDPDDRLILSNERAERLLPEEACRDDIDYEAALACCGVSIDGNSESGSLQCYIHEGEEVRPLRCDYRLLKNKKEKKLGRLLVFTDAALESDLLTGFHNWESFCRFQGDKDRGFQAVTAIAVLDLNGLTAINAALGRSAGDDKIRELAQNMRSCFPRRTYYVRGHEARLIALCRDTDEKQMLGYVAAVREKSETPVQYAVSLMDPREGSLIDAILETSRAMQARKLMDEDSGHAALLNSLMRALKECDPDTEAHVVRTQRMGAALAERIGLSDIEKSNLALLCMLHDIGKIGIPLEILNKPGKLSEAEWQMLRTHVVKGAQIARSSDAFVGIADMILHHHERWDGRGYPDGLSRESIPLLSRVIAVVDSYDAMVNERSYKKAFSREKAMEELRRCAGSQFDPYIVTEFLELVKTLPVNSEQANPEQANPEQATGEPIAAKEQENHLPDAFPAGQAVHPVNYSRYLLDEKMNIISIDENFRMMTGYGPEDIAAGLSQTDILPPEDLAEYLRLINHQLSRNQCAYCEHRIRRKDGEVIYVFCYGRQYYDSATKTARSEILVHDARDTHAFHSLTNAEQDKARRRMEKWENAYRLDNLTGLLNHSAFQNDVESQILSGKYRVMFMMMDVDHFKEYNDTFGHHAGDNFLISFARNLDAALRPNDLSCRMGGDEFACALLLPKETGDVLMRTRAGQIYNRIYAAMQEQPGETGLSMGVAVSDGLLTTFTKLYEAADRALYAAKEAGRGRMTFYGDFHDKEIK